MEDVKQQQQVASEKNKANPSKLYTNFLYKAAIVTVFLVIIPLFPSQAPEFMNQTLLTRSWELLHLVFVGIAVSYGLFSRRNDDSVKDTHHSKFDNAQSYVSRFFQVSSVFDDETEPETVTETETASGSDKVQTWSSQYLRNEPPTVVVGQELSVVDEQSSRPREKSLLLPVRSLKSRVPDSDSPEIGSRGGRSFGSKRVSVGSRNWDQQEVGENLNQNMVLPSPIPWRSRSGRLETKEEAAERESRNSPSPSPSANPLYSRASPVEEQELNQIDQSRSARPQMPRSPRPNSLASSPTAISAESQAKSVEDLLRKKSFRRSPPPPPPPPPPPVLPKSQSFKPSSRLRSHVDDERDFQRSYSYSSASMDSDSYSNSSRSRTNVNPRTHVDVQGKSVRATRGRENEHDSLNKKSVQFDKSCFRTEKQTSSLMTNASFPDKRQYVDEVIEESDDNSEDDDDDDVEEVSEFKVEKKETSSDSDDDEGPDVDKKADEFIAKFREQIRLQRIESIKKSSGQMNRNLRR